MDNATFQRIKDLILKNQEIGVILGHNPSLDETAAGLGLYLSLKQMGKNAVIACPTDPIVAVSSLVGIDQIQKSLGTVGGDLTVSFPYQEGEIEKVSYTLENGQLNIVVKAGEKGLSFQQSDVKFIRGGKMPSLVMFVGIPRISDVSDVYKPEAGQEITVINIDNKQENEKYGDVVVADPKWSSVSEQVADFVTLLEPQIELDRDTAQNLLDGIDFATEDFRSPRTSYLAFEVAGILMKKGATRQKAQVTAATGDTKTTSRPDASSFFPPIPPVKPIQQPVQSQGAQPVMPQWQPPQPTIQQPQPTQQVMPAAPLPVAPAWQPQQFAQEQPQVVQQTPTTVPPQAPPDWLTPKVYKGSTIL